MRNKAQNMSNLKMGSDRVPPISSSLPTAITLTENCIFPVFSAFFLGCPSTAISPWRCPPSHPKNCDNCFKATPALMLNLVSTSHPWTTRSTPTSRLCLCLPCRRNPCRCTIHMAPHRTRFMARLYFLIWLTFLFVLSNDWGRLTSNKDQLAGPQLFFLVNTSK
jgi:hypothetical protein